MTDVAAKRTFQRMLKGSERGEIVIPALRALMFSPSFPSFDVPTQAFHERIPDGWFHPSEHPLWGERQLYYYVKACMGLDDVTLEGGDRDPLSTMAITQGNFWHAFVQTLMGVAGYLRVFQPEAKVWHEKVEHAVSDPVVLSRGWMDGVLNSDKLPIPDDEGFEFKTAHSAKVARCPRAYGADSLERLVWLQTKCPDYYAQAQEYLRMSGLPLTRIVMMALEYPFEMIEVVVPYNYGHGQIIAEKYRRVRQAVADQEIPDPCCGIKSAMARACPARAVCPVGMAS